MIGGCLAVKRFCLGLLHLKEILFRGYLVVRRFSIGLSRNNGVVRLKEIMRKKVVLYIEINGIVGICFVTFFSIILYFRVLDNLLNHVKYFVYFLSVILVESNLKLGRRRDRTEIPIILSMFKLHYLICLEISDLAICSETSLLAILKLHYLFCLKVQLIFLVL